MQTTISPIPDNYSPLLHFGIINTSMALIIYLIIHYLVSWPTALEVSTIPLSVLIMLFIEYFAHKGPLHHKRKTIALVFQYHTLSHHERFRHDSIDIKNAREIYLVLFPWWAPLTYTLLLIPPCVVIAMTMSITVAGLFGATCLGYMLAYEWAHLMCHLPQQYKLLAMPIVGGMIAHHTTHHNKRLMGQWNYMILCPLIDKLFGTYHQP